MQKFLRLFSKSAPETDGVGTNGLILYVLWAALFGASSFVLLNIYRLPMIFLVLLFGTALFLTRQGYSNVARWLSLLSALGVITYLMMTRLGIRDSIMPGIIVILSAAGLLAGRKGVLIIGSISLGIVVLLGTFEMRGIITNKFSGDNFFSDYVTIIILIVVASILQWLFINYTHQNFQKSKQKLLELETTQNLLMEAESRYRNLIEKLPVVIYIAEPGESGAWHYISPHITTLSGYTPTEWINNPNFWYSIVHPEDRERVLEEERTVLSTGQLMKIEYRLLNKDGKFIWVYDESLLSVAGNENQAVHGYILDITARKVAEEQLQQRVTELEAMKDVSESLISHSDLDKLIEDTGDQIRQTYKASTFFIAIHNPVTNLIHFPYDFEDGIRQADDPIQYGQGLTSKIMESGKPLLITSNWEEEINKYNPIYRSENRANSSIAVPMMVSHRTIGVISMDNTDMENVFSENDVRLLTTVANNLAVAIENTNLKDSLKIELATQEKLIEELEQKNEELERFTYTASHDLKSPLITIRGFLGYIEQDARLGNTERLALDIQRISEATEKMNRVLTDLLEISRVGHVINIAENVPFEEIVQDALERVAGQLKEKQITVKVGSGFPIVFVDRERLVEVVQNLVDNATKFMGTQPHPKIEIGIKKENGLDIFFVRDNGVGIRIEFQEKIFGLFDKLDSTTEGTGAGLALVKRIIEIHGGRIWIESEEGKGATFCFTLSKKTKT